MDRNGAAIDEREIRAFIEGPYPRLVAGIALITGSRAVAEDAVQEALARAWERSGRGLVIEDLPAWVTTVALNLARSGLRRRRLEARTRVLMETASRSKTVAEVSQTVMDIDQGLRELPRRQREVAVLRYYLELSVQEIASALGVSEGTVKTNLARTRAALARRLGGREVEEAP